MTIFQGLTKTLHNLQEVVSFSLEHAKQKKTSISDRKTVTPTETYKHCKLINGTRTCVLVCVEERRENKGRSVPFLTSVFPFPV